MGSNDFIIMNAKNNKIYKGYNIGKERFDFTTSHEEAHVFTNEVIANLQLKDMKKPNLIVVPRSKIQEGSKKQYGTLKKELMALGHKNITVVDHHNYLLSSIGTEKAKSNCILFYGNLQVTRIGFADGKTAVRVAR